MRYVVFCLALILGIASGGLFGSSEERENRGENSRYSYQSFDLNSATLESSPIIMPKRDVSKFSERNFSRKEVSELIGKRVKNLDESVKCPLEGGNCVVLKSGEAGLITGIIPSMGDTFMIEIRWYEKSGPKGAESLGTFATKADRDFAFALIK